MMDTALFILGKLVGLAIRPDIWLTLGLGLTLWGLWRGRQSLARGAGGVTLAAMLGFGVLPLGDLMLRPLETQHPVAPDLAQIDGIVVLGGGEDAERSALWGQVQLGEGGERLTEGLRLARLHPEVTLVFTGEAERCATPWGAGPRARLWPKPSGPSRAMTAPSSSAPRATPPKTPGRPLH
jgi:hypothetical protein